MILPGEGHVPVSRRYALEAIRRTQAWFDRYLDGPDSTEDRTRGNDGPGRS